MTKTCSKCGETKNIEDFYRQSTYYRSDCKDCVRATRTPATQRRARYGVTEAAYRAMERAQFRTCKICKLPLMLLRPQDVHVDHDHACCPGDTSCGRCVRALLCADCNRGLGLFHEDARSLESAVRYLAGFQPRPGGQSDMPSRETVL